MTSQKRYRHQENSNTTARTRDLPPRFKRQKSTSAQTLLASRSPSPPPSQLEPSCDMTKLSTLKNPDSVVCGGNMSQRGQEYQMLQAPVNANYCDIPSNSLHQQQQVYGYGQPLAAQMWPGNNYQTLYPQQVMLAQPVLVPTGTAVVLNNENCAPSPSYCVGPVSPWNASGYGSPYHSSCSSPAPTVPSPSPSAAGRNTSPQPSESAAGYSDPDLRTIEMLRELERVADEKETKEAAESSGSDRKTLVSHHLRMIMCAMDIYTEGIEDEVSNGRKESEMSHQSSYTSSPSASPPPVKVNPHQKKQPQYGMDDSQNVHFWNNPKVEPRHQARPRPVLGVGANMKPVMQQHQYTPATREFIPQASMQMGVQQSPWHQFAQPPAHPQMSSDWNLWSSPSFNFNGLLGNSPCTDGSSQAFESFHDACFPVDIQHRKPLYKR